MKKTKTTAKRSSILAAGLIALVAVIGFTMESCGDSDDDKDKGKQSSVIPITVSGTVTVDDGLGVEIIKINIFTKNWGWSKSEEFSYEGADTPWSITMDTFSVSTTVNFQVEGYKEGGEFNPLFLKVIDGLSIEVKNQNISGISIDLPYFEIIELSGTIDITGREEPIPYVFIFVQKISDGALIGQIILENASGANTPWSIYVLSQNSDTNVNFGVQGFEETPWSEDKLFEFGGIGLNGCKEVSNQNISGIKITLDLENSVVSGDSPETLTVAERWSMYDDSETAALTYSVDGDGVCTVTVSGTAEPQDAINGWFRWKTSAKYSYTAKANTGYEYEFEAWTESGDRGISVQYFSDDDSSTYLNTWLTITDERTTYAVTGDKLPKGGVRQLEFQCADQLGTFYVKILSITEQN